MREFNKNRKIYIQKNRANHIEQFKLTEIFIDVIAMPFSNVNYIQVNSSENEDNESLRDQIDDLKGQLNVYKLQLKNSEFTATKRKEEYELQISKLRDENRVLKDKFEKISDGQRRLENQNSTLEDRLLKIVEKYEAEQKGLFEELTIAHSKLVEMKLTVAELEEQKEQYRNDCNVAVNLLQCKPGDFINHSYNSLPINLKDRLKSILTEEELRNLSDQGEIDSLEYEKKNANSLFKLPIFQPSAAAAMMYNMQNVSVQRELQKQHTNDPLIQPNEHVLSLNDASTQSNEQEPQLDSTKMSLNFDNLTTNGRLSSSLIGQVLRKDLESPSKKSFKLFPYICLRCKKESVICDQSSQTDLHDLYNENLIVLTGKPFSSVKKIIKEDHGDLLLKSDTYSVNESVKEPIEKLKMEDLHINIEPSSENGIIII